MEESTMSKAELVLLLEMLADLIEAKADSAQDAVQIIKQKLDTIK